MNTEFFSRTVTETSINVVASELQSVRKKNITKTAVRKYDGRHIGIAGGLGQRNETELEAKAVKALERKIAYPFAPAADQRRSETTDGSLPTPEEFAAEVDGLLAELRAQFPEFLFSHKVNLGKTVTELRNDAGLDYSHTTSLVSVVLLCKPKGSVRIFDTFVVHEGPDYSRETILGIASASLPPYLNEVEVESGEQPVCFFAGDATYKTKFLQELNGLSFGSGNSLFSGKTGQRLFSENFTLAQSRSEADDVYLPFFDFEGVINKNERALLIENGVVRKPYTCRKYAQKFDLPLTGAAGGEYDAVPDLEPPQLIVSDTGKSTAELLDGRKAILVYIASGGDFTPDGAFATPVQSAYVYDGERLIGKTPELAVSSHLYKMFGEDLVGVSTNDVLPGTPSNAIVMRMKVDV